jgi:hypothetical protein
VHSLAPESFDLRGSELRNSSAPVYIVGAGKTGTDTAHTLLESNPGRQVNLLIGRGMMFGQHEKFFPVGFGRHFGGESATDSAIHFLSSCSAYLLVHLAYLDAFKGLPLYEVDYAELNRKSRDAVGCLLMAHTMYNASVLMRALPLRVELEFGTNMAHWFPMHRRLFDAVKIVRFLKRHPNHLRDALDVVRERFDVRCGPLQYPSRVESLPGCSQIRRRTQAAAVR